MDGIGALERCVFSRYIELGSADDGANVRNGLFAFPRNTEGAFN